MLEHVGAGEHRAPVDDHTAGRGLVPDVCANDAVGRTVVEQAVVQHGERAAGDLLGGLEGEHDAASQPVFHGRKDPGRTEGDGDVAVVAAGVHYAVGRGEFEAGCFVDRQAVNVGPDHQGGAV